MNTTNTVPCANDDVTTAAREAFAASKAAGNDDGAAFEDVNEAIRALVGSRTGTLDQESLTWTFDDAAVDAGRPYGGTYGIHVTQADGSTRELSEAEAAAAWAAWEKCDAARHRRLVGGEAPAS